MDKSDECADTESSEARALAELEEYKNLVINLEEEGRLLLAEKSKMEDDFGLQRAKLKDLYIQKEELVILQGEKNLTLTAENEQKNILLHQLQGEVDELRSQVTIAQCTAENEVEVEKRKCREEIASVTQILKDEVTVNESQIEQLRRVIGGLEVEKSRYRSLYEQKLEECELKRDDNMLSPGMFSSVTKSFAKKVPSVKTSISAGGSPDMGGSETPDCSPNSSVSLQKAECLEESMKKVQESTTVLRSLVIPLEEEIAELKNKIREQELQLRAKDAQEQARKEFDMKLQGVQTSLKAEKATRADLELYAAILNTQKTALTDQLETERGQLQELRKAMHHSPMSADYDGQLPENPVNTADLDSAPFQHQSDTLPLLTDDQKRALSGASNSSEQEEVLVTPSSPSDPAPANEGNWLLMQQEMNDYQKDSTPECKMCIELESNLRKAENDLKNNSKRKSTAEKAIGRIKLELEREAEYRKRAEIKWRQMAEDYEKKEISLQAKVDEAITRHKEVVSASRRGFQMMHEQANALMKKRHLVNNELIRLQNENDSLVGKHSERSQEMQSDIINLPDTMEEMQLLLLKYHEDVIAAKVAKEHLEETLNSKILFLNDQLEAEQHERSALETKLSLEIEQLRRKAENSATLEQKFLKERQLLLQTEEKLKAAEQKGRDSMTRSQHFITGLKVQIEENEQKKIQMETVIGDLKSKVSSLQQDLKTSETVQRDFVRLSQSLQVHLEKIRQSDKEIRWQHEDDIEECNNCNQKFNSVGRRKHHCKHCGKIFCSECVTKTVASGPNRRPSRVCDVCHTLLVHDATPFFSTEPPHSPH